MDIWDKSEKSISALPLEICFLSSAKWSAALCNGSFNLNPQLGSKFSLSVNDVIQRTIGIKSVQETSIKFDNPDAYDRWMGVWTKLVGSEFLRWFDPEMNKTWIDIGCGSGA